MSNRDNRALIVISVGLLILLACSDHEKANEVKRLDPNSAGTAGLGNDTTDQNGSLADDTTATTVGKVLSSASGPDPIVVLGAVSDFKIEANPKNILSCFVSWKTQAPSNSVVQFGIDDYEWEISDPALVTVHRLLVIGMRAEQSYKIRAVSSNSDGAWIAEGAVTTESLPPSIPVAAVTVNDTTRSLPGWTLMNIQKGDGTTSANSDYPAVAVMYDSEGQPVWYYIDGRSPDIGGAVSTELTDKGVLIGPVLDGFQNTEPPREVDFAGNVVWQCSTVDCNRPGLLTHHASKLSNGNYVILRYVISADNISYPVFDVLNPDNQVVWSWDWNDFITPPKTPPAKTLGDWCHGNSITINIEKNEVYANCRWLGLVKTTYQNPTFQWHLPASFGAEGLGNMNFVPSTSQYIDTHDPEIHDDGTILIFDNGGWGLMLDQVSNPNSYHSRAVEYKIDEVNKTATLVWEFPGNFDVDPWYRNEWYVPFWGDADRLANGNVLITAGVRDPIKESRIFEVTQNDGAVVWEFRLPSDYGVYRAERLSPPPLVRAIKPWINQLIVDT